MRSSSTSCRCLGSSFPQMLLLAWLTCWLASWATVSGTLCGAAELTMSGSQQRPQLHRIDRQSGGSKVLIWQRCAAPLCRPFWTGGSQVVVLPHCVKFGKCCCCLPLAEAQEDLEEAVDDYLDELRNLLGVPADPDWQQQDDIDEAPDQESQQELQRLLQHIHDPVTPGAPYTLLQVCACQPAGQQLPCMNSGSEVYWEYGVKHVPPTSCGRCGYGIVRSTGWWYCDSEQQQALDKSQGDTTTHYSALCACWVPPVCLQTVIIELAIKRRNRITDSAFDELCKWHHASRAQTADNYYPRSLWLMKKIAGVEDVRKIQV